MIKTGNGNITLIQVIAILSISAVISLPGLAISPILGDIKNIFPNISDLEIQMLSALPNLLIIPFSILTGRLSVKYNNVKLLRIGLLLFAVSGLLSFFAKSINVLLLVSTLIGIGAGMILPLSKGFICDYFHGNYRIKQLGYSSVVNNGTLIIATSLAGILATKDWHLSFLIYALPIPVLFLTLFLKDKEKIVITPDKQAQSSNLPEKKKLWDCIDTKKIAGYSIIYFLITYSALVIIYNLSFVLEKQHISSEVSGTLISLFFFSIMLPGFFMNAILSRLKSSTTYLSLILMGLGLLTIFFIDNIYFIGLGCMLNGIGYGVLQPLIYEKTSSSACEAKVTFAMSFVLAFNYIATVLCPFIMDAIMKVFMLKDNIDIFVVNAIILFIMSIWAYIARDGKLLA